MATAIPTSEVSSQPDVNAAPGIKATAGEVRQFETGAKRDNASAKGRMDLLPPFALFIISRVYQDGGLKRGDRNWEKGMPIGVLLDSASRHIEKYKAGLRDEPHLAQAGWNILGALWTACMVHLGLRPKSLMNLPNHVGDGDAEPLSPYEIDALNTFLGK